MTKMPCLDAIVTGLAWTHVDSRRLPVTCWGHGKSGMTAGLTKCAALALAFVWLAAAGCGDECAGPGDSGCEVWEREHRGEIEGGIDAVFDVTTDSQDNVIAVGQVSELTTDVWIRKYDADGEPLWTAYYEADFENLRRAGLKPRRWDGADDRLPVRQLLRNIRGQLPGLETLLEQASSQRARL